MVQPDSLNVGFTAPWVTAVVAIVAAIMPGSHKQTWSWITFASASLTAVAGQTIRDTRLFEYYQYRLKGWDIIRNLRLGADIRLAQCAQNGQYETALDELCAELLKFR